MNKQLSAVATALVLAALALPAPGAARFERDFAPGEAWVKPQEKLYRAGVCLNGTWQFQPVAVPADFKRDTGVPPELPMPAPDRWERTPIKIPSPWNVNAWGNGRQVGAGTAHPWWPDSVYYPSYPASWDHAEMGWLQRRFSVPADWSDKRIVLHFEAVAGDCQVFVNGQQAGAHFDAFLPFELDVTALVKTAGENELLVGVRHHRLFNKTSAKYRFFRAPYPPGSELERIVGIWQDVYLLARPKVHVQDVFVRPQVDQDTLQFDVTVRNDSPQAEQVTLGGTVRSWINLAGNDVLSAPEPKWELGDAALELPTVRATVAAGEKVTLMLRQKVQGRLKLWSPASPSLYMGELSLQSDGQTVDRKLTRFGWRQFRIEGRDLLLNGKKIQAFGDLSHPFGPFMMSRRFAWAWYRMIKDCGGNAVRPHAQPYPRAYLDLADEMGILVLDETALFGSSIQLNFEAPDAWRRFADHYDNLVLRDRNHPSVLGWSFGNELFAIFNLNRISGADADLYYGKLADLGLRARALDPTRPWISCDGDEDLHGVLPVWSKHLGHGMFAIPDVDKPRMVGESGGTYYATPGQLSVFNGDRAYASYAGRNEALAIDLYQNITKMALPKLSYFSPSEMVWFGIEHLPLGFNDLARLPTLQDGVVFGRYAEGKPGMQLERIPPYVTTLNPGYDPALPLYRPLAMFDAMKAALAPGGPGPCPWDHIAGAARPAPAPPRPTIASVAFAGETSGELYRKLASWGVPFVDEAHAAGAGMLIVDGEQLADAPDALVQQAGAVRARGGVVLALIREHPASLAALDRLLPAPLEVTGRQATMLARVGDDPRMNGLGAADLYFAEAGGDRQILKCGLGGAAVERGKVLLAAGNTDWSLFNRVPEVAKCGAVVMYEQHAKPSGAALVAIGEGEGSTIISSIDYRPESERQVRFWRNLLARLGVKMNEPKVKWILPIATIADRGTVWRYTLQAPAEGWNGAGFDDAAWRSGEAGFGTDVPGSRVRTPWTRSDIWLRRTFELPQGATPDLKMLVHHDEDVEVYINGTLVFRQPSHVVAYHAVELTETARRSFRNGRNLIAVHCRQTVGGQYIDVGLLEGIVPDSVISGGRSTDRNLLLDGPAGQ